MKRRRYDTTELVGELKRERRNAVLLTLLGIGIVVFLAIYYLAAQTENDVPEVPANAAPRRPEQPPPPEPPPPPETTTESENPSTPPAVPAVVTIVVPRRGVVSIDGKKLGKGRRHRVELSPGTHSLKMRAGKRLVAGKVDVEAGATYTLSFDLRKRRLVLRPR